MKILLDTHALLWCLSGDKRLSKKARKCYEDSEELIFSVVSLWEIGIKLGLRRRDFALDGAWWRSVPETLVAQGARRLNVEPEHCQVVADLPLHHRDPFDRMLIAQAVVSDCRILSIDEQFDAYAVRRIW